MCGGTLWVGLIWIASMNGGDVFYKFSKSAAALPREQVSESARCPIDGKGWRSVVYGGQGLWDCNLD
jgi:hypothetical protein